MRAPILDYQYCTWNLEDMGMTYTNYQYSTLGWGLRAREYNSIRKDYVIIMFGYVWVFQF